jgi:hypothetical protein
MRTGLKWLRRIGVAIVVVLLGGYVWLWWLTQTASVSTHGDVDLGAGNVKVPAERVLDQADRSTLTDSLVTLWAGRDFEDWQERGKVQMPRVLTGKLAAGREIAEVNAYIQTAHVRGTVGSKGPLHKTGDYDFTLAGLCLLLYSFGDQPDALYPESVDHIVNVLMTQEGGSPIIYTPRVLGLPLRDTENHILMTEGSRYLKNRWKALHGDTNPEYDNVANGLEAFLLDYLAGMERAGFHEYNSRPYIGYTLSALLNLESFTAEPVRAAATRILDRANWEYAVGSLNYRRWPPFRRQRRRGADTDLDGDYHTGVVKAWMSLNGVDGLFVRKGEHQALWTAFTTYRLPDATAQWIEEKPTSYFVQIGHGHDASPEIYSGGPGFLITAGGVSRDRIGQQVARPTTLMLEDGAMDVTELLQLSGPGSDNRGWNNTGVYERFAVAAGPVTVPDGWQPDVQDNLWAIYSRAGQMIATHSADSLGLFYLMPDGDPEDLLARMTELNGDGKALRDRFLTAEGVTVTYDVSAPKDRWVIVSVDGVPTDQEHPRWPLMQGNVPGK